MNRFAQTALLALVFAGCAKVPITGRRQLSLMPESQVQGMSFTAYSEFLSDHKVVDGSSAQAQNVTKVGERMAQAVTKYLTDNKMSDRLKGFKWEFHLVESNEVNAWCMPGGKVVVYTGILPIAKDEAGLAVIMGHEIAHAIARHGNERMSQQMAVAAGGIAVDVFSSQQPALARSMILQSFGVGSELGILAYSRTHESEADKLGLVFMAMAGYDPRTAPEFWKRMAADGGKSGPEFLSTHPSDENRIKALNEFMPQALKYYQPK